MTRPRRDIVVMGASAGGVEALRAVLSGLPADFPAAVFVTIHTMPTAGDYVAEALGVGSSLTVKLARDGDEIRHGHVYVAPPNLHLIIKRGRVRNRFLPKENGTRPAIDPMFRSAAHSYSRRVIGVLLTGHLDDGTAGLGIIQDEGGVTIVQDPEDALHPDMPLSAIDALKPDHVVPLLEIPAHLVGLVHTEVPAEQPTEERESKESYGVVTCPGCGGVVRTYDDGKVIWFQCRVGHRFSSETMILEQNTVVEEHFWRMIAILKEKEDVARTMAKDARATAHSLISPEYFDKQAQAAATAQEQLHAILDQLGPTLFPGAPHKEDPRKEANVRHRKRNIGQPHEPRAKKR